MRHTFAEISEQYLKRRSVLKLAGLVGASTAVASTGLTSTGPTGFALAASQNPVGFKPLPLALETHHAVARGYHAQVLIAWGDSLGGEPPVTFPLNAAAQAARFGFNNDFLAYVPLTGSRRGLLCVNHEYPSGQLMFPGYDSHLEAKRKLLPKQVHTEMASVGHSVIEVERRKEGWAVVSGSRYARRIHAGTPMQVDGPAAGHSLLKTKADPGATEIRGTLGCCAGGKTPWGTVLIAEENVGDYFRGETADVDMLAKPWEVFSRWADVDSRFDLQKEPNELNRFGWIVEYDPRNPEVRPVKRTSLGRFEHEGATVVATPGAPLVVYSGDDSEDQAIYRFVSSQNYDPENTAANRDLLAQGTLYCARFNDDGTGVWLPLQHGEGPLTRENGFSDQASVLVNARRAARLLGATPMDRPEGLALHPSSGRVYAALTKHKKKTRVNAPNPRARNAAGHILEFIPPEAGGKTLHARNDFHWDLLLQGGDHRANGDERGDYGSAPPEGAWLANPDNLAFDGRERLWVATDGMNSFDAADGLWCTAVEGDYRAVPHHFFRCPRGAELCGPEFTPDGETLFVSVQHPADELGSTYAKPSTRWPDFKDGFPPRPGIVAITKEGGGMIGD